MKTLITGSSGLIGSEVSLFFAQNGCQIHGVDNNQRAVFFGPQGDTRWNQERLAQSIPSYTHHEMGHHYLAQGDDPTDCRGMEDPGLTVKGSNGHHFRSELRSGILFKTR